MHYGNHDTWMPTCPSGMPGTDPALLPTQLPLQVLGRKQMMLQILGFLPSTREMQMEFLTDPGLSLACTLLLRAFDVQTNRWHRVTFSPLSSSLIISFFK